MEPTKIVSRREIIGKNNNKAWLYKLDDGTEHTITTLPAAFGLDIMPQTIWNRMKVIDYRDPKIFRKPDFKKRSGPAKQISSLQAKILLQKWNRKHKVEVAERYIEIPGYEPVFMEEGYSVEGVSS